jgi:UDPglucose 6-dehydrogenase
LKIDVIGLGYVGLVASACLAEEGHKVTGYDTDTEKLKSISESKIPFYEPNLNELVKLAIQKQTLELKKIGNYGDLESDAIIIAVGTPLSKMGTLDISQLQVAIKWIISNYQNLPFIIIKSTVPPGTGEKLISQYQELTDKYISNPEFLREGQAIEDWKAPDRIISGSKSQEGYKCIERIYKNHTAPFVHSDITSSEMIKFASNAFLANKISFINEIANLCDKLGAYIDDVSKGIGLDPRIGPNYLIPGVGYGGSCFPKDVQSLSDLSMTHLQSFDLLQSIITTNQKQQLMPYFYLSEKFENLKGLKVCVLGLSFKAGTDDVRESSAINLINQLSSAEVMINTYDPVSINNSKKILPDNVIFFDDPYDAIKGVQVTIIMTDWNEFQNLDWEKIYKSMENPKIIFDGKNFLNQKLIQDLGFEYFAVGRKIKSGK